MFRAVLQVSAVFITLPIVCIWWLVTVLLSNFRRRLSSSISRTESSCSRMRLSRLLLPDCLRTSVSRSLSREATTLVRLSRFLLVCCCCSEGRKGLSSKCFVLMSVSRSKSSALTMKTKFFCRACQYDSMKISLFGQWGSSLMLLTRYPPKLSSQWTSLVKLISRRLSMARPPCPWMVSLVLRQWSFSLWILLIESSSFVSGGSLQQRHRLGFLCLQPKQVSQVHPSSFLVYLCRISSQPLSVRTLSMKCFSLEGFFRLGGAPVGFQTFSWVMSFLEKLLRVWQVRYASASAKDSRSVRWPIFMLFLFRGTRFNRRYSGCCFRRRFPPWLLLRFLAFSREWRMAALHQATLNRTSLCYLKAFMVTFVLKSSQNLNLKSSSSSFWMYFIALPSLIILVYYYLQQKARSGLISSLVNFTFMNNLRPSVSSRLLRASQLHWVGSQRVYVQTLRKCVVNLRMKPIITSFCFCTKKTFLITLCTDSSKSCSPRSASSALSKLLAFMVCSSSSQNSNLCLRTARQVNSLECEPSSSWGKERWITSRLVLIRTSLIRKDSSSSWLWVGRKGEASISFSYSMTPRMIFSPFQKQRQNGFIFLRDFRNPSTNKL